MSSSLKFINLVQKAKHNAPSSKLIAPRMTYYARILGMTEAQKQSKRVSNVDAFKTYTEKILPDFEEVVEAKFLRERYNQLENPFLQNEFLLAYKRRQITIAEMRKSREPRRNLPKVVIANPQEPVNVYLNNVFEVNDSNIGNVVAFPRGSIFKYFPLSPLGDYIPNQYRYTRRFCLQCTNEAFRLTNEMRKLNYARLTEKDYEAIFLECENTKDVKTILNDEELYPRIFHDISLSLLDKLQPFRADLHFTKLFTESYIFDTIVNTLVRELASNVMRKQLVNSEKRGKILDQILTQLRENTSIIDNPQRIDETLKTIKHFKITYEVDGKEKTYTLLMKKYLNSPRALPQRLREWGLPGFIGINSGAMITGIQGSGKSCLLMYAIMWAHANEWIVVNAPDAYYLTQEKSEYRRHHDSGLYLEFAKAFAYLRAFKDSNYDLIKNIPVNMDLYGKMNIAGVHDGEPEPVPVTYDKERKYWSNDWEQFIDEEEKLHIAEQRKELDTRLSQKLPEPKTLLDIINYGLAFDKYSVNAIAEVLEQLYNIESHRVLVAVDNYNYFFLPSVYPSFRYANNHGHENRVPAHHLALSRLFMKFDGHKIKNGMKLVAPTLKRFYKHTFTPEQVHFGKGYEINLKALPFDDYVKFMEHLKNTRFWFEGKDANLSATEQKFLESQGNYYQTLIGIIEPNRLHNTA